VPLPDGPRVGVEPSSITQTSSCVLVVVVTVTYSVVLVASDGFSTGFARTAMPAVPAVLTQACWIVVTMTQLVQHQRCDLSHDNRFTSDAAIDSAKKKQTFVRKQVSRDHRESADGRAGGVGRGRAIGVARGVAEGVALGVGVGVG
jgi:hypothetical protein